MEAVESGSVQRSAGELEWQRRLLACILAFRENIGIAHEHV